MEMTIPQIAGMPTTWKRGDYPGANGIHESVLRSYNALAKVKWLLKKNVPHEVILTLIHEMEDAGL